MNNVTPPPSTLRGNSEIFSEIYANNIWGKPATNIGEKFSSGGGSHVDAIVKPYINILISLLTNNNIRNIVDLGCGDFWIMRQVLGALDKNSYNYFYTGIDVVEDLINHNVTTFKKNNISFRCMDAAADDTPLPDGDILIIRQVLQHLSNADIKTILNKASTFKYLFITESIYDDFDAIPNVDKLSSADIRLRFKSGVYLEHKPYNFKNIVHLLKVYGGEASGVRATIRSSLIIN